MSLISEVEINPAEAEMMAMGLYAVARADGKVHDRELFLIKSFFQDAVEGDAGRLAEFGTAADPAPEALKNALNSAALADTFLKTALLVAWADNDVTANERALIESYAAALGVPGDALSTMEQAVKETLVGQLAHLANVEGAATVAKKIGITG